MTCNTETQTGVGQMRKKYVVFFNIMFFSLTAAIAYVVMGAYQSMEPTFAQELLVVMVYVMFPMVCLITIPSTAYEIWNWGEGK